MFGTLIRRALGFESGLKERFTEVYHYNLWGDRETRSGSGSRRDSSSVADTLRALEMAVERFAIRSIADIPCGDFNWIGTFLDQHPDVSYVGYDIVEPLIAGNRKKNPRYEFRLLDITASVPPRADLILCKDLLNHLPNEDVHKALANFAASGSQFLLASNNFGYKNSEIFWNWGSESRHLDITTPPFNYAAPVWTKKGLGLWQLSDFSRAV